jgi:hypothetical protein
MGVNFYIFELIGSTDAHFDLSSAETSESFALMGSHYGVPMSDDLVANNSDGEAPVFLLRAVKAPMGANLGCLQVVKCWVGNAEEQQERVYNVAWSDDRSLDASGNFTTVGNTVELSSGRYTNTVGQSKFLEIILRWFS